MPSHLQNSRWVFLCGHVRRCTYHWGRVWPLAWFRWHTLRSETIPYLVRAFRWVILFGYVSLVAVIFKFFELNHDAVFANYLVGYGYNAFYNSISGEMQDNDKDFYFGRTANEISFWIKLFMIVSMSVALGLFLIGHVVVRLRHTKPTN